MDMSTILFHATGNKRKNKEKSPGTTLKYINYPQYRHYFDVILMCHTRWRSWLRHCATNRKVAGSIP
jgi:hypothetical protein